MLIRPWRKLSTVLIVLCSFLLLMPVAASAQCQSYNSILAHHCRLVYRQGYCGSDATCQQDAMDHWLLEGTAAIFGTPLTSIAYPLQNHNSGDDVTIIGASSRYQDRYSFCAGNPGCQSQAYELFAVEMEEAMGGGGSAPDGPGAPGDGFGGPEPQQEG